MFHPKLHKIAFLAVVLSSGLMAGCSSVDRTTADAGKKDPFADPSRFESLASAPFESPNVAPIASANLTSAPEAVHPAFEADVSRSPASVTEPKGEEEISSPEGAYSEMLRGNERFVTGAVRGAHRDAERRRSLASVQHPHTIVLSCSDSRVPPELIFDQGLGDIFTIRVAGNILGSGQVASIEYAVEHLGAKLIVVMGHESCGAVKAALAPMTKAQASEMSPDMQWMISSIKPNLSGRGIASTGNGLGYDTVSDPKFRKPVMANVDAVTEQLLVRSKTISGAISKGNLKIVKGIYSLDSGKVDFWGLR